MDERLKLLAKNLVNNSCRVQVGENVLIHTVGFETVDLARAIVKEVYKCGANPFVEIKDPSLSREISLGANETQLNITLEKEMFEMKNIDCYIGIRGGDNIYESSDVPTETKELINKILYPVVKQRVDHTKWVILRYPNGSMAQNARMSKEAFEDFYFEVCNLDYQKMNSAFRPLQELMQRTDKVRLVAPNTDLSFSIKGIPAVICSGECNIPDGEIYTAPVKNSINGKISYNAPSLYNGNLHDNITLEFKDGKIVNATSSNTELLNKILDTDEGARYVGEFAIGVNPYVNHPMYDIMFDEKIAGSIHFTPGACYEDAPNGNNSAVHWDLVLIQTPEYGGGEIYFDDVLIRKDGRFIIAELECLNPENLK